MNSDDGMISEEEFMEAIRGFDIGNFERLFHELDVDGSGFLNKMEVRQLATKLGAKLSEEELLAAMQQMDSSGDGQVDSREFSSWWRGQEHEGGGVMSGAVARLTSAQEQEHRWFFSEVEGGDERDGKISLRDLSAFVWAWEAGSEFEAGEFIIAFPGNGDEPAIYTARQPGKTGAEQPSWAAGEVSTKMPSFCHL